MIVDDDDTPRVYPGINSFFTQNKIEQCMDVFQNILKAKVNF